MERNTRYQRRGLLLALFSGLLIVMLGAMTASADTLAVDFESYAPGTVDGQDGWQSDGAAGSGCAVYDHAVANNTYGFASFGARSLRISNAVTSGCFSDQTFSKSNTDEAGETSAVNDGMSGGTRRDYFEAEWDFASTVPGSEQAGLSVVASPDRGDGARMSWVQMADKPGGLEVNFYEYDQTADPGCSTGGVDGFVFTNLVSGLDRTVPHTIKITMDFVDGADNDVVRVYVDGNLEVTGGSWEDYFRDCESNPTRPVDSILFRTGGANAPATAGNGFVIDNLSQLSGAEPCTTVCYADAVGGNDANGGTSAADAKKTIQAAIDTVSAGGEVRVLPGAYAESPHVDKSLTLVSTGGRDVTTIALQPQPIAPTYLGALQIDGETVTVDGFTITGFDADCADFGVDGDQDDASTNVYATNTADTVTLVNNRFKVGNKGACTTWDDAIGVATYYNLTDNLTQLTVEDNLFEPAGAAAARAFYVNPAVDGFTFRGNTINGQFNSGSYTQAMNGLIENNTINGTGTSRGVGTWGYPDPTLYGATVFRGNTISNVANGITIYGSENVTVTKNVFTGNDRAVWVDEDVAFDLSTIHINRNSIAGNDMGVENWYMTEIDASCNWWGDASGPAGAGSGSGDPVDDFVDFGPWLDSADLDGGCGSLYISPNYRQGVIDGVAYGDEDILMNVLGTSDWEMYFDGSDVGVSANLTDFTFTDDDCILMTFNGNQNIPGVWLFKPQDIAKFCPTSLGGTTAGTFELYFDGSDVGLNARAETIDSLDILPGGELIITTKGKATIPQPPLATLKATRSDLLIFTPTTLGTNTSGTWDVYMSYLLVDGLKKANPIGLDIEGDDIYMSLWANYKIGGVTGDYNDIILIHPDYSVEKFWDGNDYGYTGRVHGLHIVFD